MGWIRNIIVVMAVGGLFQSCFTPPEYPVVPQIEFSSVQFKDVPRAGDADSLILTLRFKDGDGDLGLNDSDTTNIKYANKLYYRLANGTFANFALRRRLLADNIASNDTLPAFVTPFNCTSWEVLTFRQNNVTVRDTLFIKLNPNHYNIFVEFLVKNNDGSFTAFDPKEIFIYPNCVVNLFNGRFPVLSKNLSQESPLEGTIRYSMRSSAFLAFFSIKTLKLRVTVQDRALNKSNEIITPEFTLR